VIVSAAWVEDREVQFPGVDVYRCLEAYRVACEADPSECVSRRGLPRKLVSLLRQEQAGRQARTARG